MTWLQNLKEGDEVITSYGWDGLDLRRVTKATSTQIHIDGTRYRRKDGRQVGCSGFSRDFLREPTPAARDKVEQRMLLQQIVGFDFKKLPLDKIRQVAAIIKPPIETQPTGGGE